MIQILDRELLMSLKEIAKLQTKNATCPLDVHMITPFVWQWAQQNGAREQNQSSSNAMLDRLGTSVSVGSSSSMPCSFATLSSNSVEFALDCSITVYVSILSPIDIILTEPVVYVSQFQLHWNDRQPCLFRTCKRSSNVLNALRAFICKPMHAFTMIHDGS